MGTCRQGSSGDCISPSALRYWCSVDVGRPATAWGAKAVDCTYSQPEQSLQREATQRVRRVGLSAWKE
ncbi:hypothetical protein NDU88_010040 [Pleurodeles waltl]|uniref:Uncharacterized protein n=1 Tax=Pleurodeles waltl TaxID=8319 RepID=A0AAV7PTS0_PLEWA|nr:hypothetical protein NDU88_010040 [Pleurodeles waltl]